MILLCELFANYRNRCVTESMISSQSIRIGQTFDSYALESLDIQGIYAEFPLDNVRRIGHFTLLLPRP